MRKVRLTTLFVALGVILGMSVVAQQQMASKEKALTVSLAGTAEVPGPGDADGTGTATVTFSPDKGEVCYELKVSNIDKATAAHIHEGAADKAGPVKVGLTAPAEGTSKGCAKADAAVIKAMMENPANFYVNVHNAEFKGGAVRGQLAK